MAALDEKWGKGFVKPDLWMTIVWASLSGKDVPPLAPAK
jgi:hypothetical protein